MEHLMKRSLALLCVLAMLFSLAPATFAADQGEFTILSTTDMHGRCWETNILNDTTATNTMLQVATAVAQVRAEKSNVLLLENGDTYQGTPVSSYQLSLQKQGLTELPNPMALAMKYIGYDTSVIGNHEFNYDWETMSEVRDYLENGAGTSVPTLCANLYYDGTDGIHAAGDNVFTPYIIKEITIGAKTYKIAIIGFENTDCPRWDVPDNYPGIVFTHPDNTTGSMAWEAERYLKDVQDEGADFVIVSYHSGLGDGSAPEDIVFAENSENQILSMIYNTQGIDMVIAGHDHSTAYSGNKYKDKSGKDVLVVNGGGNNLTCSTFGVDADGEIYLKSHEDLVLKNYAADQVLKEKIKPYVELASEYVNQVCGTIKEGTWSKSTNFYLQQTDTMDLVNRAQIAQGTVHLAEKYDTEEKVAALYEATGLDHLTVDVSSSSVVVSGSYTVQPGEMTMKDIYRLYRYDNTLYLVPLTGAQIKAIMEFNAENRLAVNTASGEAVFSCINDSFTNPVFYGLDFQYDMAQEAGSRVVNLKFSDGRTFEMDKTYIMAINNYHLGNGPFADYSTSDAIWSQTDDMGGGVVQDLISEFLKAETAANGGVSPAPSNWSLIYSGEIVAGTATGKYVFEKMTSAADLYDGAKIAVYHISGNQVMTNVASGTKLAASSEITIGGTQLGTDDEAAVFTAHVDANGYITMVDADGKYVTSAPTGNGVTMETELTDCGKWEIVSTDNEGQYYLHNVGANYGGNYNQYLEVYFGAFTTYGLNGGGDAYAMSIYVEPKLEGTYVLDKVTDAQQITTGSKLAVYHIAGNQIMTNAASGSKLAASSDVSIVGTKMGTSTAAALFNVTIDEENNIILTDADGKYVTSASTGNGLTMETELTDCGKWSVEAVEGKSGCFFVRNVGANYMGNYNQGLQVYLGNFTTYGLRDNDAFYMGLYMIAASEGECSHANTEVRNAKDAKCTEDGYTGDIYCKDCGEKVATGEVIDATGHQHTETRNAKDAKCTEDGYTGDTYCKDCGEKVATGEVIEATDHPNTEERNYKEATCTEDGYSGDIYCKDCGALVEAGRVVPANKDNCPCAHFTDLNEDWYHEWVDYVVYNDLMRGTSSAKFSPRLNLRRADAVVILYRMAGSPDVEGTTSFVDLEKGAYYVDAVTWAVQNGIVKGVSKTAFDPLGYVTREQFVSLIARFLRFRDVDTTPTGKLTGFKDIASISDYAVADMTWAVEAGIIQGMNNGKLEPQGYTNRAQAAKIIAVANELMYP